MRGTADNNAEAAMLSEFLTEAFRETLKEAFPKFAYWLFYSEMTFALLLGVLFCFAWPVGPLVGYFFFVYAAVCWIGARNYGRKRAVEKNMQWAPSRLDLAVAVFLCVGLVVVGLGFFFISLGGKWSMTILGAAVMIYGVFKLKNVLSGKWITFP
jgi:hypothetical protein